MRLRLQRSPVVAWFVLWREIYHRAILDFCQHNRHIASIHGNAITRRAAITLSSGDGRSRPDSVRGAASQTLDVPLVGAAGQFPVGASQCRYGTSRFNLGQRWPARLVATAEEDCLSFRL